MMLYPNGSAIRPRVSSPFGPRDGGAFSFHYGADLVGYVTIRAAGAGKVTFAGWLNDAAGNTVVIDLGGGVTELHMHMASFSIARGDLVGVGAPLGAMGKTGNATGNCDHFEIRVHGTSVEPLGYVAARIATPTTQEETIMEELLEINGKIYLAGNGSIKHCETPAHVEELKARTGIPHTKLTSKNKLDEFVRALDMHGVPRDALNGDGLVLNPQSGRHEPGALWNWSRAVLAKLS